MEDRPEGQTGHDDPEGQSPEGCHSICAESKEKGTCRRHQQNGNQHGSSERTRDLFGQYSSLWPSLEFERWNSVEGRLNVTPYASSSSEIRGASGRRSAPRSTEDTEEL